MFVFYTDSPPAPDGASPSLFEKRGETVASERGDEP